MYGRILKIDSTKKITKKLQGAEANTASWVTNISNKRGEVLNSVVTTSESMQSLQGMVDGIVNRFSRADVDPPVLLYTDQECCSSTQEGGSKFRLLFSAWENLQVRLDIFHFMRRLAVGVTSESHPTVLRFHGQPVSLHIRVGSRRPRFPVCSKKARAHSKWHQETVARGRAVGKKELALHCRRRTRGAEATENLLESLLTTMAPATDVLGVPLFPEEMLAEIWPEQKKHVSCIQDPPPRNTALHSGWHQHQGWQIHHSVQMLPWNHIVGKFPQSFGRVYTRRV